MKRDEKSDISILALLLAVLLLGGMAALFYGTQEIKKTKAAYDTRIETLEKEVAELNAGMETHKQVIEATVADVQNMTMWAMVMEQQLGGAFAHVMQNDQALAQMIEANTVAIAAMKAPVAEKPKPRIKKFKKKRTKTKAIKRKQKDCWWD